MVTEFQQFWNFTNKCKKQKRRNLFYRKTRVKLIFSEKNGRCYSEFIIKKNDLFELQRVIIFVCYVVVRVMVCFVFFLQQKKVLKKKLSSNNC